MPQQQDAIDRAVEATLNREPEIDYLLLADRAEVIDTKVYLMGGGWDTVTATTYPHGLNIGVIVGFRIPWSQANLPHDIQIELRMDGGPEEPLLRIDAQLETGRPPGRNGKDMLVPMAFNGPVGLPQPGDYVLTARIGPRSYRQQVVTAVQLPKVGG